MALIVEPGHRVVGLRRQPRADDAALVLRLEHRKPPAAHEAVHQRGDEDGLAGPRQAGDAESHRRIEQAAAIFRERARGAPGFFEEIGQGGHGSGMWRGGTGSARLEPIDLGESLRHARRADFDRPRRCANPMADLGDGRVSSDRVQSLGL